MVSSLESAVMKSALESAVMKSAVMESSLESAVMESSLESAVPGVDYCWTPGPGPVGVHGEVVERPEPEIRRLGQWPLSNGLLTPCLACSPPGV